MLDSIRTFFVFTRPVDDISEPLKVYIQTLFSRLRLFAFLLPTGLTIIFSVVLVYGTDIGRGMPSYVRGLTHFLALLANLVITIYCMSMFYTRDRDLNDENENLEVDLAGYALMKSWVNLALSTGAFTVLFLLGPKEYISLLLVMFLKSLALFLLEIVTGGEYFSLTVASSSVSMCYGWAWNNPFGEITGIILFAFISLYIGAFEWRRHYLERQQAIRF
ncbi:hypothetical protein M5689_004148 [Euphorbia peplus]|nr:hypothetical protein M5689_004148 [Euphorbia peplus]